MKFLRFSRILPALAALVGRSSVEEAKQAVAGPVASLKISNSGGHNVASSLPLPPPLKTTADNYHPIRNQRKRRKANRRAWAAGDKFAFSPKN